MSVKSKGCFYLFNNIQQLNNDQLNPMAIEINLTNQQLNYHIQIVQTIFKYSSILQLKKDTIYLTISYLTQISKNINPYSYNFETFCLTLLFLSTKINEINPPTLTKLLKLAKNVSREQVIELQFKICESINFDLMIRDTHYSVMANLLLKQNQSNQMQKFQKILYQLVRHPVSILYEIYQLALTTLCLVKPSLLKSLQNRTYNVVKEIGKRLLKASKQQMQQQ